MDLMHPHLVAQLRATAERKARSIAGYDLVPTSTEIDHAIQAVIENGRDTDDVFSDDELAEFAVDRLIADGSWPVAEVPTFTVAIQVDHLSAAQLAEVDDILTKAGY